MTTEFAGTMLVPGVSRNNRLYTPEATVKAFNRLRERIADPDGLPVTMLTHHAAGDDSELIAAQVFEVSLNSNTGGIDFRATPASTPAAQGILKLVTEKAAGGKAFLRNVSIRGSWMDTPTKVTYEGHTVETADDYEIDGLDFTKDPGVLGATVAAVAAASNAAAESADGDTRVAIVETVAPVRVTFTETVAPDTGEIWADPGYRGVKRLPLDTLEATRASAVRLAESDDYSPRQRARIERKIRNRLAQFGETMTGTVTPPTGGLEAQLHERRVQFGETGKSDVVECYDPYYMGRGGFSLSLYNGPLSVTVSAYDGLDPADLDGIATKAMAAALVAAKSVDPDVDPDEPIETTSPGAAPAVTETAHQEQEAVPVTTETTPAAAPAATTTPAPVTETAPVVAETAPAALTETQIAAAVATAVTEALKAAGVTPAVTPTDGAPVTETTPVETPAEIEARLTEAITGKLLAEARVDPELVRRKGLVEKLAEEQGDVDPNSPDRLRELAKLSDGEFREQAARVMDASMRPQGARAL